MIEAPVIETERLMLRPHRADDLEAYAAFMAADRAHYIGGPYSRDDTWDTLMAGAGEWVLSGHGAWAVEARHDGALAGRVNLSQPDKNPEPELGWAVFDGFEGQGIAFEAACAARESGFRTLGHDRSVSYIYPDNDRSTRFAERIGARPGPGAPAPEPEEGHLSCLVYVHHRGEMA
ncbi:MAG: GNAT family N-acetyltransferase [Pseudomonadota bacterium]